MELVLPSEKFKQSFDSYINELGDEERYPFTLDLDMSDFKAYLSKLGDFSLGKNLPAGSVTNTTFWLIDNGEVLGVTNIRHYLNEQIRCCGGHIGLGIRPKARGKGIGSLLMKLSIDKLATLGVTDVHIHCYQSNTSSAHIIKANGGVLNSEINMGEQIVQRYIVKI